MSINAQADPMNEELSDVPKNKTWEKTTLKKTAGDIAGQNNIPLDYQTGFDIDLAFVSQTEKSDKVFLHDLCDKYGLVMKMYTNKIVIFDPKELEQQAATIRLSPKDLISFSCEGSIANTGYSGCTVRYYTKDGETLEYTATTKGKTDKVYRHDAVVDNLGEAQRVAESQLYQKNLPQTTFSGSMPGRTDMVSGICIEIQGFGNFDGKYFVDKATHSVGGGYKVSIETHGVA
jgi:phage protein D